MHPDDVVAVATATMQPQSARITLRTRRRPAAIGDGAHMLSVHELMRRGRPGARTLGGTAASVMAVNHRYHTYVVGPDGRPTSPPRLANVAALMGTGGASRGSSARSRPLSSRSVLSTRPPPARPGTATTEYLCGVSGTTFGLYGSGPFAGEEPMEPATNGLRQESNDIGWGADTVAMASDEDQEIDERPRTAGHGARGSFLGSSPALARSSLLTAKATTVQSQSRAQQKKASQHGSAGRHSNRIQVTKGLAASSLAPSQMKPSLKQKLDAEKARDEGGEEQEDSIGAEDESETEGDTCLEAKREDEDVGEEAAAEAAEGGHEDVEVGSDEASSVGEEEVDDDDMSQMQLRALTPESAAKSDAMVAAGQGDGDGTQEPTVSFLPDALRRK